MRNFVKGIAATIGLLVLLFVGLGLWGNSHMRASMALLEEHRAALASGDSTAAYVMTGRPIQDAVNEVEFIDIVRTAGLWRQDGQFEIAGKNVRNGVTTLTGVFNRDDGASVPIVFVFAKEDGTLRIIGFRHGALTPVDEPLI